MTYNLHPIFIHFPIALLFIYSIIKVLPLKKWLPKFNWKDIERVLLLLGVAGACAALFTGDAAQHLYKGSRQLVHAHAMWAAAATALYGALLGGEIAAFINEHYKSFIKRWPIISTLFDLIENIFCNPVFSVLIAIVAFIAICVTGLLGGTIVYGVTADPIAGFVLKLLGLSA